MNKIPVKIQYIVIHKKSVQLLISLFLKNGVFIDEEYSRFGLVKMEGSQIRHLGRQ